MDRIAVHPERPSIPPILSILLLLVFAPALVRAEIVVESEAGCVERQAAQSRLESVVARHAGAERLTVVAVTARSTGGFALTLRAVNPAGDVVLERRLELAAADCASGPAVLAAVLDGFLTEMPRSAWGVDPAAPAPAPEPVIVLRDVTQVDGMLFAALASRYMPFGAELEAGASADVGSARHGLTAGGLLRAGTPQRLGGGSFWDFGLLASLGWRYAGAGRLTRAELRVGAVMVAGSGFASNRSVWLPWVEAQVGVLWEWGGILLGPELALSPLRHDIVTSGGTSGGLPWLRAGLRLAAPFFSDAL